MPFAVRIVGLRDLLGRFASMRDVGLVAIQREEATAVAKTIQEVFRRHAPRSQRGSTESGRHFYSGLVAETVVTGGGFRIELTTDKPALRRWLTEGTGIFGPRGARIYPKTARALMWTDWPGHGSGPFFARSIAGMEGRPWEREAKEEVEGLVETAGNLIGVRVVQGLADHA